MANLLEIAELAWRQLFPQPGDETAITREEFIATAKTEYAYQWWLMNRQERILEGFFLIPSHLSGEAELEVVDNEIDTSDLKVLRSLPNETWLQNIGGLDCECRYVKSNVNHMQLLCDDDSLDDNAKTYLVVGKKIKFPKGVHKTTLPIIYAKSGSDIDGDIEVDDAVGGIVRTRLVEIYGGRTGPEDKTNNSNSNVTTPQSPQKANN